MPRMRIHAEAFCQCIELTLADGSLQTVLDDCLTYSGQFSILWPSGRLMSPRLRVFVDFVAERLFQPSPP